MSKECERAKDGLTMAGTHISFCNGELETLVYPSEVSIVACEWHASIIEAGL